jgi:hypothetical protein
MKQILIEKYIEPSGVIKSGDYVIQYWLDRNYNLHSFMGQPARIVYEKSKVEAKFWYKKSTEHRDRGLPAEIYYKNEKETSQWFYKNGKFIKSS